MKHKISSIEVFCPKCSSYNKEEYEGWGTFDRVFSDEPRFPGRAVYECPECGNIINVNSKIKVRVNTETYSRTIAIKTDDYLMKATVISTLGEVTSDARWFDIKDLEEEIWAET